MCTKHCITYTWHIRWLRILGIRPGLNVIFSDKYCSRLTTKIELKKKISNIKYIYANKRSPSTVDQKFTEYTHTGFWANLCYRCFYLLNAALHIFISMGIWHVSCVLCVCDIEMQNKMIIKSDVTLALSSCFSFGFYTYK